MLDHLLFDYFLVGVQSFSNFLVRYFTAIDLDFEVVLEDIDLLQQEGARGLLFSDQFIALEDVLDLVAELRELIVAFTHSFFRQVFEVVF